MSNHAYAHPEKLVETEWVAEHRDDPNLRIVESDEDILLYEVGHIPGAVKIDWVADLNDPLRRDYIDRARFEQLLSKSGIANTTRVIFYGDKNNWWACYALWVFQLFGHTNTAIMNGGRQKWLDEGRELSKTTPSYPATAYKAPDRDDHRIRAFRDDVFKHIEKNLPLVDVRSAQEYSGELLHMPGYPQEGALRGGHVPGAKSLPWSKNVAENATFKTPAELRALYDPLGITPDRDIIAYCRIGERSALTWFVLTYLLGYPDVRNYDGSWTEWGNLVGAPIEK
ncbi:sulfurtransferase [Anaerolineae bacterium CFX7]|nr:sulfurtransferase [Anaerolineae bacterium CFX7]